MRRLADLAGQILGVPVDPVGNGPEALGAGAAAAGIAATAPEFHLISIFAPDNTHSPCWCPWSGFVRSQAPGPLSGEVVAASRT